MNIVFEPFLSTKLESSVLYEKTAKDTASFAFYINIIFKDFKIY